LAVLCNFNGLQGLKTKRELLQIIGPSEAKAAAERGAVGIAAGSLRLEKREHEP
jgi:hypothetical protein